MILHVLPGDAIVDKFQAAGFDGDIAVCREALIEGDLAGDTLPELWENRARFFAGEYPGAGDNYHEKVVREFAKLTALQSGSEVNLWFEYELFCQTNLWFCLSLVLESAADVFRVAPVVSSEEEVWDGFGNRSPDDLKKCFAQRVRLSSEDVELGASLWSAYRAGNHDELRRLSSAESKAFPKLREVCAAAIEKESRPNEIVREIIRDGEDDFDKIFIEFKKRAGVYGYGDAQVKKIWRDLVI
ncbi:MAG TPA: hypothetical protein VMZ26_07100 [Pyrinomonadaceae bacterium]|nr:hypothetical protein [Pyrinomonadaceae bacterium]